MVGTITYTIEGVEQLETKLKGLGSAVATKIGSDSLVAGANYLAKEIRRRAPVRTGALKRSVRSQIVRIFGSNLLVRTIGFVRPGRSYSHLVEFGTVKAAAHPFVRPSLDAGHNRIIAEIGARLGRGIEAYAIGQVLTTLSEDNG